MIRDRDGNEITESTSQDRFLQKMYGSLLGRVVMKCLSAPMISKAVGWFLTRPASKIFITPFVKKYQIDMNQYKETSYHSFDDFFARRIKTALRPVDQGVANLISPCDGKLTVYSLSEKAHFYIKQSDYTLTSLLQDEALARNYSGGYALVFRLTVDNFHRYCYIADGVQEKTVHIPGVLHSVNPIVNEYIPVYKENTREYCICHTEYLGDFIAMEVGALMVGKIENHYDSGPFYRGEEKGYFRFGGSTIILLFPQDSIQLDADILFNSALGYETLVKYGEKIGVSLHFL